MLVSIINLFVWLVLSLFLPHHFPWFIFVLGVCAMTLSLHYFMFVRPREFLYFHYAWYLIINALLFVTWVYNSSDHTSHVAWFLYPLFSWGILLGAHTTIVLYKGNEHQRLYTHLTIFGLFNLFCFATYLDVSSAFPWFLVVFFALAPFPLIHWNIHYHRGNFWRLHLSLYLDIQILLFVIWLAIASKAFAWFTIPLFSWGILLGVHYSVRRRRLLRSKTATGEQPSPLSINDPEKGQQSNSTEQPQSTETPLQTPSLYPTVDADTQHETPLNRNTQK